MEHDAYAHWDSEQHGQHGHEGRSQLCNRSKMMMIVMVMMEVAAVQPQQDDADSDADNGGRSCAAAAR